MKILQVGAGGYARHYVRTLLSSEDADIEFVGVVDPFIDASPVKDEIYGRGIPVYRDMEEFYKKNTAELVLIATPPHLHGAQSLVALSHGANVLCEKPVCPTVEEAEKMLSWEKEYGRFIAVGYQWSYATEIQALKRDILDGVFGRPIRFKTLISWPRKTAYFGRGSGWGGRIERNGIRILDSVASNACAHYLHNMLFLLGGTMDTSASPEVVRAWLRRANDIENFDTSAVEMTLADGTELLFVASHAARTKVEPVFSYTFENAEVRFEEGDKHSEIVAYFHDGRIKSYGRPKSQDFRKIGDCIEAVRTGTRPICTVETAMEHTRVINLLYEKFGIKDFDRSLVHERIDGENVFVYVDGLDEILSEIYETGKIPDRLL